MWVFYSVPINTTVNELKFYFRDLTNTGALYLDDVTIHMGGVTPDLYALSGTVTDEGGSGLEGVTLTLSGAASATTSTDASGSYTFAGLSDGTYTITPSRAGYVFEPPSREVTINGDDVTGLDFTATAIVSACPWTATPTSTSGVFLGQATIDGVPAAVEDCVAAFDEEGNVAGVANIIVEGGDAFINLTIYGDDTSTTGVDEGINTGESFSLKLYDASADETLFLASGEVFTGWQNTNGAPMPGYDDPDVVYDFTADLVTQVLPLKEGWNLNSLYVQPVDTDLATLLGDMLESLIYVTGFDPETGAQFYDPDGLDFLNTLTAIEAGRGYWVKVAEDVTFSVGGPPLPSDHAMDLLEGWNLIGYWIEATRPPADVFADLIDAGSLIYVTGFDPEKGAQFYDPDGLPFLNTLDLLERGRGYWVKVTEDVIGFQYPPAVAQPALTVQRGKVLQGFRSTPGSAHRDETSMGKTAASRPVPTLDVKPTNAFMFVQGTVQFENIDHVPGDYVEILNRQGQVVGAMQILDNGYLLTTPVYGDDATTPELDGAVEGEMLSFRFAGIEVQPGLRFTADMSVQRVSLNFATQAGEIPDVFALEANYPNPFNPVTTIRYGLPQSAKVRLEVYNTLGQRVAVLVDEEREAGWHEITFHGGRLASGVYLYRLKAADFEQIRPMLLLK